MPGIPITRGALVNMGLALYLAIGCAAPGAVVDAEPLSSARIPARLTDAELWRLTSDLSEAGGDFQSDNFTSNEETFPEIAAVLEASMTPGGIYVGVGPEQNFSYIAALRPRMAFIIDIRRQAVIQHLLYKALFELSSDRAEFISRLFSKPRPAGLDSSSSIDELWHRYWHVPSDSQMWAANLRVIRAHLTGGHRFSLGADDLEAMTYVYRAFYDLGPIITYGGYHVRPGAGVTFAALTAAVDSTGAARSFLATEQRFRFVRDMHRRNMIVPIVGDFGGQKAIRGVGDYVRRMGATVTAFYVSNVEQYLFRDSTAWKDFYHNVERLPLDSVSTFIRPWAGPVPSPRLVRAGASRARHDVMAVSWVRSHPADGDAFGDGTSLCPIGGFLTSVRAGRVLTYGDVLRCPP